MNKMKRSHLQLEKPLEQRAKASDEPTRSHSKARSLAMPPSTLRRGKVILIATRPRLKHARPRQSEAQVASHSRQIQARGSPRAGKHSLMTTAAIHTGTTRRQVPRRGSIQEH